MNKKKLLQTIKEGINLTIHEIPLTEHEIKTLVGIYNKCEDILREIRKSKLKQKARCDICNEVINKCNLQKHKDKVHRKKRKKKRKKKFIKIDVFAAGKVVSGGGFGVGRRKRK